MLDPHIRVVSWQKQMAGGSNCHRSEGEGRGATGMLPFSGVTASVPRQDLGGEGSAVSTQKQPGEDPAGEGELGA